jgi:EmrB/QacA subfamily drug resistance transporter
MKLPMRIVIFIVSLAYFMEWLDASALNTALPQIAMAFHTNPVYLKEALTAYLLSVGIFIPVSGFVCDKMGIKPTFMMAIILFMAGSIGCSFSHNVMTLVSFRILQGIGGAFLTPVGRMILLKVYGTEKFTDAMSQVVVVSMLGMVLGPLLGGAMSTWLNWRWIFWINIPVCISATVIAYRLMPDFEKPKTAPRFDLFGFITIGLALALALYAVDILIDAHIPMLTKALLIVASAICFATFIRHIKRCDHPLFNVELFKIKRFSYLSISSFLARIGVSTPVFLVPLLLQSGYRFNAFDSGLMILPYAIAMAFFKPCVKPMLKHLGVKNAIIAVMIFNTVMLFSFQFAASTQFHLWPLLLMTFLAGIAFSINATLMNVEIYSAAPKALHSQAVPTNSAVIQLGASFAVALAALFLVSQMGTATLTHYIPLHAFRITFMIEALFPLAALFAAFRGLKH